MKLWVVKLNIFHADDMEIKMNFKYNQTEEDYEVYNKEKWTRVKHSYLDNSISRNIELKKTYGNYTVRQGFDRKLNKEDLKTIENNMKVFLKNILIDEKQSYVEAYDKRIELLGI